jgi:oligopeptide transport system substrate-binding protein
LRSIKNVTRVPVAALAAALLLAGCQGKVQRPACPAGQVCLEYGNTTEPLTLDPQTATTTTEFAIVGDLIMGLTTDAPDASVQPGAATSWETSPDGLVWTFHLRRDAVWSDGVPVTADDFVYAYRRILDPNTAASYAYLIYIIKNAQAVESHKLPASALGVRAVDKYTLELTLEHPAPHLPELLKHSAFYPVPKHTVEKYGEGWVTPGRYVSNAGYTLVSWKLGDYLRIQKNPRFWDAKNVCVDRVDFYPTTDAVAAERRVKRGELDINNTFQSSRIALVKRPDYLGPYVRTHIQLSTTYLGFNTRDYPALADRRVRQALSEGIDREFIAYKLMRAGQVPAYSFTPPAIASYEPGAHLSFEGKSFAARQDEARALLKAAGFGPGRPLKIVLSSTQTTDALLIIQAIQADWRDIGVEATLQPEEGQIHFADMEARNFQVGIVGWSADFNDPTTFLDLMLSGTGAQNYGDYRSPVYDGLMAQADQEKDLKKRAHIMRQAEQVMLDDATVAPIYFGVSRNLVNPKITGWVDNAEDFHKIRWLCVKPH